MVGTGGLEDRNSLKRERKTSRNKCIRRERKEQWPNEIIQLLIVSLGILINIPYQITPCYIV